MKCNITDLHGISEAVNMTMTGDNLMWVRETLYNPEHHWFKLNGLYAHVEKFGPERYQMHTFGVSRDSMRDKLEFFVNIGVYLLDNTDCSSFHIFVPESHLRLRVLINKICEPICYLPGSKEFMYVFDNGNRDDIERRFLCHK